MLTTPTRVIGPVQLHNFEQSANHSSFQNITPEKRYKKLVYLYKGNKSVFVSMNRMEVLNRENNFKVCGVSGIKAPKNLNSELFKGNIFDNCLMTETTVRNTYE